MYKDVAKHIDKFTIKKPATIIPKPSTNDYDDGFIERFFVRVAFDNNGFVYEVNEKTFDNYSKNTLWITERMFWRIVGPLTEVYDNNGVIIDKGVINSNKASISIASLKIPNISLYLPNLLQFHK